MKKALQEAEAALRGQRGRAGNAIQQRQARIVCRREFVLRVVLIFRNQGQQKTDHCYPAALAALALAGLPCLLPWCLVSV